jgi:lipoprotein-anchoring transpeptidase ErfK/SrfK
MTLPKIFLTFSALLFGIIAIAAMFKSGKKTDEPKGIVAVQTATQEPIAIDFSQETATVSSTTVSPKGTATQIAATASEPIPVKPRRQQKTAAIEANEVSLPNANRIEELFNKTGALLPIVETITYKSRVAWQKGRPAWLSDYASHYKTSRHFIARSLNGNVDYFKQDVADGDRFNVFKEGKNISFYLLVDSSRCKMWFYSLDNDTKERILLKRYDVGLGRKDDARTSGSLTPIGKYSLGNKIAIYKPTMTGHHNGQKVEMIRVFGTRWIPFDKEIGATTTPAKGFGIHGVPWINGSGPGGLVEDKSGIGKYQSDGCIRMATSDVEELFAIVITKPTTVDIVADYFDAELPGKEKR